VDAARARVVYLAHVPGTTKSDFETLADLRIAEARVLLDAGKLDGALYLGGYAVECAIKAVIAKTIAAQTFPPEKGSWNGWFVHRLSDLIDTARLGSEIKKSPAVFVRWTALVNKWSETKRYEHGVDQQTVEEFLDNIDGTDGVLPWLKQHW
jgi:hypothetical protein